MLRRAAGTPIRIASKSVRVRAVLNAALALPGFRGVLAYTLAEALWLAEGDADHAGVEDVVLGYPTADRSALRRLATSPELARRVTLMVDSVDHLDFIDRVLAPGERENLRVALELDASWLGPIGRIIKTRVLSDFSRQRLKPFTSFGRGRDLLVLAELLADGQITPLIDRTYRLDEASDALRYVAAGHSRGKVVITVC